MRRVLSASLCWLALLPARAGAEESSADSGIVIQGASQAERLRESAEAVKVLETEQAARESSDLGAVLARTPGVSVRRAGGLGSDTRFSLNGLQNEQIRFTLDGLPLDYVGHVFGVANVPVNVVERVEIYSGVVPLRFGADALGGVVNLVTDQDLRRNHAGASFEAGSFDTYRLSAGAQTVHGKSGLFARFDGFFDSSQNDYLVDVTVPNADGRVEPARVRRFHDGYQATGAGLELGVVRRPWARRLSLRVFGSDYDKDIQHNVEMTVPYGAVTFERQTAGGTLRYQQTLGRGWSLDLAGGYSYARSHFIDVTSCVYDWFGRCVNQRQFPGEAGVYEFSGRNGTSQLVFRHLGFARLNATFLAAPGHALRLTTAPTLFSQTGQDLRIGPELRDPSMAQRGLFSSVSGAEYELDALDERLESIAFVKHYLQSVASDEPRPEDTSKTYERLVQRFGAGVALRFRLAEWMLTKASYEAATRTPSPDEIFGDNAFIHQNLDLLPETGHNLNAGAAVTLRQTPAGAFRAGFDGFLRETAQLIIASTIAGGNSQVYRNVYDSRTLGLEANAGWSSLRELFALDGNLTVQRAINTSDQGTFGAFEGSALPNRPSLFANLEARVQLDSLMNERDQLILTGRGNFIAEFFRGWGDVGDPEYKEVVPRQLTYSALATYVVNGDFGQLSATLEVQNLTNAKVYDFFGVQKPGRAFYGKMTGHRW